MRLEGAFVRGGDRRGILNITFASHMIKKHDTETRATLPFATV